MGPSVEAGADDKEALGGGGGGGLSDGFGGEDGAGGGSAAVGETVPAPGFTIKECLHFGHLILAPWGGTRESSKLYLALQLGQTIRILTSSIGELDIISQPTVFFY